jgi:hypothetical protein
MYPKATWILTPDEIKARTEAHRARRLSDLIGEWERMGEAPPTIGGIPVSKELLDRMGVERAKP